MAEAARVGGGVRGLVGEGSICPAHDAGARELGPIKVLSQHLAGKPTLKCSSKMRGHCVVAIRPSLKKSDANPVIRRSIKL